MIEVLTLTRISPECPFKSIQRQAKFLILTLGCAVWLCGVMHTLELDSAVWCTLQSLTPQWDAHPRAWHCCLMHSSESDSTHTAESEYFKNVRFCVFKFVTSFNYVWSKNNLLLKVWFNSNILRHHHRIINDRMEKSVKGRWIGHNLH